MAFSRPSPLSSRRSPNAEGKRSMNEIRNEEQIGEPKTEPESCGRTGEGHRPGYGHARGYPIPTDARPGEFT